VFTGKNSLSFQLVGLLAILLCLTGCVEDESPVANAGFDRTITSELNSTVLISGEASFDPSGDSISYHWTIEEVPEGSEIALPSYEDMEVEVKLDESGIYRFGLVVTDGNSSSRKDIITIRYFPDSVGSSGSVAKVNEHPIVIEEECFDCHEVDGPSAHISMDGTIFCNICHFPDTWVPIARIEHAFLSNVCTNCHEKSNTHIEISDDCGSCHQTYTWAVSDNQIGGGGEFDHSDSKQNCIDCHSANNIAIGKPSFHVATTDLCEACHSVSAWRPIIVVDHAEVLGSCVDCHNGTVATGRSATHFASSNQCDACHTTIMWIPGIAVDHTQVLGLCNTCHNGVIASGKMTSHINSTDACAACHATTKWKPVVLVDHSEVLGACESCHTSPVNHVTKGVVGSCEICHLVSEPWRNPSQPLPAINSQNN